jgi:hypothetical protein
MKTAFFLLVLCSSARGATCPTGQMKDETTLVQIEHTWVRAVEQHDPRRWDASWRMNSKRPILTVHSSTGPRC